MADFFGYKKRSIHVSSGAMALAVVLLIGSAFNPGLFLSYSNIQNIFRQTVTNAFLAF